MTWQVLEEVGCTLVQLGKGSMDVTLAHDVDEETTWQVEQDVQWLNGHFSKSQLAHTTLLLALLAERLRQVLRLQVGSSERRVQVVFVISLDESVIPSNKNYNFAHSHILLLIE